MRRRRGQRGFSLIECVVALGLLGAAMVAAISLLNVLATASLRTEMNSAMLRELENSLEMMRAGVIPLETGPVAFAAASQGCPDHLSVNAVVMEGPVEDLFEVMLRAECHSRAARATKTVTTQMWNR